MTNQSSEIAIDVDNVSKIYKIWTSPAARLRGPLVGRLGQLPFLPPSIADWCLAHSQGVFRHFYALRDVSFSFYRGETIGIIADHWKRNHYWTGFGAARAWLRLQSGLHRSRKRVPQRIDTRP
jgi:hypothetical protein